MGLPTWANKGVSTFPVKEETGGPRLKAEKRKESEVWKYFLSLGLGSPKFEPGAFTFMLFCHFFHIL